MARSKDLEQRLLRTEQLLCLLQKIIRLTTRELSLQETLSEVARLVNDYMESNSCLIYLLSGSELVLCASANPHPSLLGNIRLKLDEGLTGWVARERLLVAISQEAYLDPRFKSFTELPEDKFEAFLSAPVIARGRMLGVINVQHRDRHQHSGAELEMITTVGELTGCLLLLARMSPEVVTLLDHAGFVLNSQHQPRGEGRALGENSPGLGQHAHLLSSITPNLGNET